MTGGILAAGVLAGLIFGWAIIPILAAVGLLVCLSDPRHSILVLLTIAASVAGVTRSVDSRNHDSSLAWTSQAETTGQITSAVVDDGRTQRFVVHLEDGRVVCARAFSRARFGRGDRLAMTFEAENGVPVSDGFAAYLRAHGCDASGTILRATILKSGSGTLRQLDQVRAGVARRIVGWVPGDSGALLAGLVIGDDSLLSDETVDAFQTTGTLHVVAISGSNLTLLVTLLLIASFWSPRRGLTDTLALFAIWAYVLIGGASPPTLRAGFLATVVAGSRALGRPADLMTLSLQVAAVQALIWPSSVLGLSYQLSTAAIFAVLIASNGRSFGGFLGAIKLVLLTTLVVNVALLPILPLESRPGLLLSLIANTLIAPFVSTAFLLGLMAVIFGSVHPLAGEPFALVAGEVNDVTIGIVRSVASQDWLPSMLRWDGSNAHQLVLILGAIVVLMAVSTEFRRALGDLRRRLAFVDDATGMLWLGSGIGAFAGVLAVAVIR